MAKIGRNRVCPCGSGQKYKRCCAAKGAANHKVNSTVPIEPERIHSVLINHKQKQIVYVSNDVLYKTLQRDALRIIEGFDAMCADDLKALNEAVVRISGQLVQAHAYIRQAENPVLETMFYLWINAFHSTVAALQLTRNGFRLQPGVLIRVVIETVCVIAHLCINPRDHEAVKRGNFDSTKAIKSGKQMLPPLGAMYGQLSEQFVHIGGLHTILNPVEPYEAGDASLETNLMNVRLGLWLVSVVGDLAFYRSRKEHEFWKDVGGGGYAYDPSNEATKWTETLLKKQFSETA